MGVPFQPIKIAGSWVLLTGSWRETTLLFEGKKENRCEKVENNSKVSVFSSNPNHDNFYPLLFDPMPPLWASYAICTRVVDIGVDMIISDG